MLLSDYQTELEFCLARAGELLDGRALPVRLEWELRLSIEKLLVLETRRGLGQEPPVMFLEDTKRGHSLTVGMERCRWATPEGAIHIVKVVVPYRGMHHGALRDFWAVRADDYRRFYRFLRREIRKRDDTAPPVLPDAQRQRLWDNTIGFLRRGQAEMTRYGVWPKRGVLLLGKPGNGKTMACRWLAAQCRRNALEWSSVTAEMYEDARRNREVPDLFWLPSPGIILFDDFDAALRDRETYGDSDTHATFLAELDGLEQKAGIVFLFTSNAQLKELDPAMCRPGRIDVIVHFPRPDATLRRRLILERWHPDLIAGVDIAVVVGQTDGFSFAELEEAKKLLVMRRVDTGSCDWPWVRAALCERNQDHHARRPIGFHQNANDPFTVSSLSQ